MHLVERFKGTEGFWGVCFKLVYLFVLLLRDAGKKI